MSGNTPTSLRWLATTFGLFLIILSCNFYPNSECQGEVFAGNIKVGTSAWQTKGWALAFREQSGRTGEEPNFKSPMFGGLHGPLFCRLLRAWWLNNLKELPSFQTSGRAVAFTQLCHCAEDGSSLDLVPLMSYLPTIPQYLTFNNTP